MDTSSSDDALVRRSLEGDRGAFALLHERYGRLAQAVALDAGRDRADDIAQEAFLRAFRNLDQLREPARFGSWLAGIVRQVVRESRRLRRTEPLPEVAERLRPDPVETADEEARLLECVALLPDDERLAVRLFFLTGRGAEETAQLLGKSRSSTYRLIASAVAQLARLMGVER